MRTEPCNGFDEPEGVLIDWACAKELLVSLNEVMSLDRRWSFAHNEIKEFNVLPGEAFVPCWHHLDFVVDNLGPGVYGRREVALPFVVCELSHKETSVIDDEVYNDHLAFDESVTLEMQLFRYTGDWQWALDTFEREAVRLLGC